MISSDVVDRYHERIANEANALHLVESNKTIPVPPLLSHETHEGGTQSLVTELTEGETLNNLNTLGCFQPEGKKHRNEDGKACSAYLHEANSNAVEFVESVLLPQLAKLKSRERGIDGFVMPPSWLSPDVQPLWKGKTSWSTLPLEEPEYAFLHGDLASHNIMMDKQTLKVKALIDWEHAGFYPKGMERWLGSFDRKLYYSTADQLSLFISKFLAVEYLKCYDSWGDKEQLKRLIEAGELPDPRELR